MKVTTAQSAGFCFGVKRAVDQVYEQVNDKDSGPVYTYGPIIHNDQVVNDLKKRGVKVLESIEDLDTVPPGTVVIRSHGVSRITVEKIEQKGFRVIDATCPFVKRIHRVVEEQSTDGFHIIIIGNDRHPEVEGIKGWCRDRYQSFNVPQIWIKFQI